MDHPTADQILRVFGRNVEFLAARKGITLKALAADLQISGGALSRARKATRFIDVELLLGCARVLDSTADELLHRIEGVTYL
jgi:transcriptional regulator with XRE-family HTH domain